MLYFLPELNIIIEQTVVGVLFDNVGRIEVYTGAKPHHLPEKFDREEQRTVIHSIAKAMTRASMKHGMVVIDSGQLRRELDEQQHEEVQ